MWNALNICKRNSFTQNFLKKIEINYKTKNRILKDNIILNNKIEITNFIT